MKDTPEPSPQLWRMSYNLGRRVVEADSFPALIDALAAGYQKLDNDNERYGARVTLAHNVQSYLRVNILVLLSSSEIAELKEEEFQVLWSFSVAPSNWNTENIWESEIPLVLVRTDYAPHTDILVPSSPAGRDNIIWIDPTDEPSLLRDLRAAGYLRLEELPPKR